MEQKSGVFGTLNSRLITAGVLIALVALVFLASELMCLGRWLAVTVAVVCVGMSAYEFSNICATHSTWRLKRLLYFLILMVPCAVFLLLLSAYGLCELSDEHAAALSLTVVAGTFLSSLLTSGFIVFSGSRGLERSVEVGRELFLGAHLIGVGGASLLSLMYFQDGVRAVVWIVITVCVNDSAAYFFDGKVRGPKLSPVISPNKTISGSAAGFIGGIVSGILFSFLLPFNLSLTLSFFVALLCVAAAQIGDLSKSLIKRLYSVKDSGTILPGHGGILDRVDGIFGAAPVILFLYLLETYL